MCEKLAYDRYVKRKVNAEIRQLRDKVSDYLMTCDYIGVKERVEILDIFENAMKK